MALASDILSYLAGQKLLWIGLVLTLFYLWTTRTYRFWAKLGVPYKEPVPLLGNIWKTILNMKSIFEVQEEIYYYQKDSPVMGAFNFTRPHLMLRDPELIGLVMVKDFTHFMDRGTGINPEQKMSAHLLNLTGQKWRSLRHKLTPVFTSGKLKGMLDQLEVCTDRLKNHLAKDIQEGNMPIEAKYTISGYTLDVIGSCAFGLEFNAIDDPNATFRKLGERIFAPSKLVFIKGLIRRKLPEKLLNLLRLRGLPGETSKYFTDTLQTTIKTREEKNIQRNDFVQQLMEIRKQEQNKTADKDEVLMTDNVLNSNAFVFLLAGFETTASTLSFMLYELAVNQDIQERLYQEVREILRKHNNQLTWDILKEMEYMEMVLSETLRKYPPAGEVRRVCLTDYTLPKANVSLPRGTLVSVPIYSLHHDPQYYPQPERFDPQRFSKENQDKITKHTYLPFGDGPRICIGMRFAQMEIKMLIARLSQEFVFKLNPKTISPLRNNPGAFLLAPVGGIWLDISLRKKEE